MAESFFALVRDEQLEALQVAAAQSGRPAHLLEKDVWVVWSLDVLFRSPLGESLVFKGGTSLSKAYAAIRRFSEDVDLTYDIRSLVPDLVGAGSSALPPNKSRASKWTKRVRERLPDWVKQEALPIVQGALEAEGLNVRTQATGDLVLIDYDPLVEGSGYVSSTVKLEFGARSTGEPWSEHRISTDAAEHLDAVDFPTATARVMCVERTFWEKATAAHVFCLQGRIRGERYARHWSDLARLAEQGYAETAFRNRGIARHVAEHKSWFFSEKDRSGKVIDYHVATSGGLRLVPSGDSRRALEADYDRMVTDGLFLDEPVSFDHLMSECEALEADCNGAYRRPS